MALANAICDIAHRWAIYFSAFCTDQNGLHYIKSSELATSGIQLASQLIEVIEEHYLALMDTCNRRHIVGSAWIANHCGVSLSEEQASHFYDDPSAWQHVGQCPDAA